MARARFFLLHYLAVDVFLIELLIKMASNIWLESK